MQEKPTDAAGARLSREEIRHVCGDIPDWKIVRIIATGGGIGELEKAAALVAGADDIVAHRDAAPHGAVGEIHDILVADEDVPNEDGKLS